MINIYFFYYTRIYYNKYDLIKKKYLILLEEKREMEQQYLQLKNEQQILEYKLSQSHKKDMEMGSKFKDLSNEALSQQTYQFIKVMENYMEKIERAQKSGDNTTTNKVVSLIDNIKDSMGNTYDKIENLSNEDRDINNNIKDELLKIHNTNQQLQMEISKVRHSLKSPNVKGLWGEMQLKKIMELSGMEKYCDYDWQPLIGEGQKPDTVVKLPNNKNIIIDSKVPLSAYLEYINSSNDKERKQFLQSHVKQLKNHIIQLSNKAYWKTIKNSADFVVLFLSGESFLSVALEIDSYLLEFASKNNIVIATPTTMISLLKTIAYGWENIYITEDLSLIKEKIKNIKSSFESLTKYIKDISKDIGSISNNYNNITDCIDRTIIPTIDFITNHGHNKNAIDVTIDDIPQPNDKYDNNEEISTIDSDTKIETLKDFDNSIEYKSSIHNKELPPINFSFPIDDK